MPCFFFLFSFLSLASLSLFTTAVDRLLNMASDGPPGTDPNDLGSVIAALNTWSVPELQGKLVELGAPTMGKKSSHIVQKSKRVVLKLAYG